MLHAATYSHWVIVFLFQREDREDDHMQFASTSFIWSEGDLCLFCCHKAFGILFILYIYISKKNFSLIY